MSAGLSVVLQQDLATSSAILTSLVPGPSAAYQGNADQILRSTVERRDGLYRIELTISDLQTQKNTRVLVGQNASVIALVDALGKSLDPSGAGPFSTRNVDALRLFCQALATTDRSARTQALDAAVVQDPAFGLAQIARLENTGAQADWAGIPVKSFTPLDQARWQALQARLVSASIPQQSQALAQVLGLAPNNIETLATLGTDRFLEGQPQEGERLLRRAIALAPANTNLVLQLAQGFFAARMFRQAADVIAPVAAKNPNLLPSVALLQLVENREREADATMTRFLSFLPPGSPAVNTLTAQWERFKNPASAPPLDAKEPLRFLPDFADPSAPDSLWALRRSLQRK